MVTMIANSIPLEEPPGGPNFHEFGPGVQSDINIDGAASAVTDGLTPASVKAPFLNEFPYLPVAYDGFVNPS